MRRKRRPSCPATGRPGTFAECLGNEHGFSGHRGRLTREPFGNKPAVDLDLHYWHFWPPWEMTVSDGMIGTKLTTRELWETIGGLCELDCLLLSLHPDQPLAIIGKLNLMMPASITEPIRFRAREPDWRVEIGVSLDILCPKAPEPEPQDRALALE